MKYTVGMRVKITNVYPYGSINPTKVRVEQRGKPGKVVNPHNENLDNGFVPVLLDEDQNNPEAWGYFLPEELEVVE